MSSSKKQQTRMTRDLHPQYWRLSDATQWGDYHLGDVVNDAYVLRAGPQLGYFVGLVGGGHEFYGMWRQVYPILCGTCERFCTNLPPDRPYKYWFCTSFCMNDFIYKSLCEEE